jgi:methyl-accepting chemotaxis protein
MRWFIDLTTRSKLFIGFGLMLLFLATVIAISYANITKIQQSQADFYQHDFPRIVAAMELRAIQSNQKARILGIIQSTDRSQYETAVQDIAAKSKEADECIRKLSELSGNDPQDIARIEELKAVTAEIRQARIATFKLIDEGKNGEAKALVLGPQSERHERRNEINKQTVRDAVADAERIMAEDARNAKDAIRLFIAVSMAALLVGIALPLLMGSIIATPLKYVSEVAGRIAGGDLRVSVPSDDRRDEIGILTRSFGGMVENLRKKTADTLEDIMKGVDVLAAAASEIMATTSQLASGAAETATAVGETSVTVGQIKQAAEVSNRKAQYVMDSAQRSADVSQSGKRSVEEMVERMHLIRQETESVAESIMRLSEQSQAIGEIIATVNDLAEQSNLLAVNAAIEAAKAGEYGKGFAVVAQEVRSLAEQSKQATAQVRAILTDTQRATSAAVMATERGSKAVEAGVKQAAEAGQSIGMLADSITESAQAATQIAASNQQQMVGMDQVAIAMENVKQASEQTAASTRQAEITAHNLHEVGQNLRGLVEQYKV